MKKKLLGFIILAVIMICPLRARALIIDLDTAFSNFAPGDDGYNAEYGSVAIEDMGNDLKFTITVNTDVSGILADIQYFYFNSNIEIESADVTLTGSDIVASSVDYNSTDSSHRPDGDGFFDIFLDFGAGVGEFGPLQETSFLLQMAGVDLGIEDVLKQSYGHNQKGHYTVAAHFQTTSTTAGSEFLGGNPPVDPIPEPATCLLLLSGLIGMIGVKKKIS